MNGLGGSRPTGEGRVAAVDGLTVLNIGQNYHVRGGSDRYLFALEELLVANGHRVVPFAARNDRNEPTEWARFFPRGADLERPGVLDPLRFLYSPAAARALDRLIRVVRPDVAHLHIYYGKLTGSILGTLRSHRIPVVQTLHDFKLICPVYSLVSNGVNCEACEGTHYWRALPRRCNRGGLARTALSVTESYLARALGSWTNVDHFIAVSDFQREKLIRYGLPADRVTTVPHFVEAVDSVPSPKRGEYFLYFGRLEAGKGIHTLVTAAAAQPDVPLLIAGEGRESEVLARRLDDEKLRHVRLLGFRRGEELADLIRGSICTVSPSHWYETFGLTVLESFAQGRPVIASESGGLTEIVSAGEDGFLVAPHNVEELRSRLAWFATHRDDAVRMGQAGWNKVRRRYRPDQHYVQLMALYRRIMAR